MIVIVYPHTIQRAEHIATSTMRRQLAGIATNIAKPDGQVVAKIFKGVNMAKRVWYCRSCEMEYDINDEGVKLIRMSAGGAQATIIDADGRAHGLSLVEYTTIQRLRYCSNHTLSPVPSTTHSIEVKDDEDEITDIEDFMSDWRTQR